jgi:hypothetical protein
MEPKIGEKKANVAHSLDKMRRGGEQGREVDRPA